VRAVRRLESKRPTPGYDTPEGSGRGEHSRRARMGARNERTLTAVGSPEGVSEANQTSRRGDHRGPATGPTNHQCTSPGAMTAKEPRDVRHERSRATSRQRDGAAVGLVLGCRRGTNRLRRYDQPNSLGELGIDITCLTPILTPIPATTGWGRRQAQDRSRS